MFFGHQTATNQLIHHRGKINLAVGCTVLQLYLNQLLNFSFDFLFELNIPTRYSCISCKVEFIFLYIFYLFRQFFFTAKVLLPHADKLNNPVLFTPVSVCVNPAPFI